MEPTEKQRVKNKKGRVRLQFTDSIERYTGDDAEAFDEFRFRRELKECGLDSVEVELVLCRMVDKWTWADISKKLGLTKSQGQSMMKAVKLKLRDAKYGK